MPHTQQATTHTPAEVLRLSPVQQATNGICYASSGEVNLSSGELQRMVDAVPQPIAAAMTRKAFYFVPLVVADGEQTLIADRYDVHLSDRTVCHRNLTLGDAQCVFISTRFPRTNRGAATMARSLSVTRARWRLSTGATMPGAANIRRAILTTMCRSMSLSFSGCVFSRHR